MLITSDRTHIYFAFKVYESKPDSIEALQTRRDGSLGFDDQVIIELDPFLTYREISKFSEKDADAYPRYNALLERVAAPPSRVRHSG